MSEDKFKAEDDRFRAVFDAMLKRPRSTLREAFEAMSRRTRPVSKMIMPRSVAAELGVDVSELPGNLVQVADGKIEGIYVEPEENPFPEMSDTTIEVPEGPLRTIPVPHVEPVLIAMRLVEAPVEKRLCDECMDSGFVSGLIDEDGALVWGDDYCHFLTEPWHHPLP